MELPPRARRIPFRTLKTAWDEGTTSACAENTTVKKIRINVQRNYLRVRGEYIGVSRSTPLTPELPPRARRIHARGIANPKMPGTTSACAENTTASKPQSRHPGNYLRVRGEYWRVFAGFCVFLELPPRARRILVCDPFAGSGAGTTSACAENTIAAIVPTSSLWNYLRVRGEYACEHEAFDCIEELPPRARRIQTPNLTPCAPRRNYLRVRGEYGLREDPRVMRLELPPRARRIQGARDQSW